MSKKVASRKKAASGNNSPLTKKEPQIDQRPIDSLVPYANNARTHSDEQVAQIAASIREFGWTNPVLVDGDNGIIAGHGRVLAARKLGYSDVPCIELAHLTDTQKRAYVLADNRLAEAASWDNDLLALELGGLNDEGFDLGVIGFGEDEIDRLLSLDDSGGESGPSGDEEYRPTMEVAVECEDETDQEAVFKLMTGKGYKCRVLSM